MSVWNLPLSLLTSHPRKGSVLHRKFIIEAFDLLFVVTDFRLAADGLFRRFAPARALLLALLGPDGFFGRWGGFFLCSRLVNRRRGVSGGGRRRRRLVQGPRFVGRDLAKPGL